MLLIALAVPSAVVYYWECSSDQASWTASAQTAQARSSVAELTPGTTYYFRFRTLQRDGTMKTSQVVKFMVT